MQKLIDAIDQLVASYRIDFASPGVAIAIHQPGIVGLSLCYGLAEIAPRINITAQTLFELASVSKLFTSTSILILSERGRLSLKDEIRDYFPELPEYGSRPILISDLLRHTSGLPEYVKIAALRHKSQKKRRNIDYLRALCSQRSLPKFGANEKYE